MIVAQTAVGAHLYASATGVRVLAGGDNDLGAGFIAFMVVVAMGVACFFLFRSMSRHLKNVPTTFEVTPSAEPGSGPATPAES